MSEQPIFVVGASRSGTELMRFVLNQHPAICVSAETHYFDDLRPKLHGKKRNKLTESEIKRCENYFLAIKHRPYGDGGEPEHSPLSAQRLRSAAAKYGGGADAFFQAFCMIEAAEKNAMRWGEKTPRHIFCLKEIFDVFPSAQVICMIRDPRSVIASYRDWNSQKDLSREEDFLAAAALKREKKRAARSYNLLVACFMWKASVRAAFLGQNQYTSNNVFIQRYEDLVENPTDAISRLVHWLSLDFNSAMLNVPITNSSYSPSAPSAQFEKKFIDRWRSKLTDHEIAVIQTKCGGLMQQLRYQLDPVKKLHYALFREYVKLPVALARIISANYSRIGSLGKYIYRRARFASGK